MVTRDTRDQEFAANRQMFLTEQGYRYDILYEDEVAAFRPTLYAASGCEPIAVFEELARPPALVGANGA